MTPPKSQWEKDQQDELRPPREKSLTDRLREQDWPEAADRIDELEGVLREIDDRAAEAINTALAKKQGGLADEFVWICDAAHEALGAS